MFRHVSVNDLLEYKKQSKKWLMLTSYDSLTSSLFDELEIPVILVGDSAAQLVFGHDSTVPVTMEEMLPIVGGVARANKHSLIIADIDRKSTRLNSSH